MNATERPPLTSVILRTFNRQNTIAQAVRSVLEQTCADFELIIVDDGSTDATDEVLSRFDDPRIVRIRHPENRGAESASNTGVRAAQGTYITFIDSDDLWLPERLEILTQCISGLPPEYGVVYSDMWEIDPEGNRTYLHSPEMVGTDLVNRTINDHQVSWLGNGAVLIRRDCFDRAGLFDEEFRCYGDREFFIRLSQHYRFYHVNKPLYLYYRGDGLCADLYEVCIARLLLLKKYPQTACDEKFLAAQCDVIIGYIRKIRYEYDRGGSEYLSPQCSSISDNLFRILDRRLIMRLFPQGSRRGRAYRRVLDSLRSALNPHLVPQKTPAAPTESLNIPDKKRVR